MLGNYDEAERCLRMAVRNDEVLAAEFPKDPADIREHSVQQRGALGLLLVGRGRAAEGLRQFRWCVEDLEEFIVIYPSVIRYRQTLLRVGSGLAVVEGLVGDPVRARAAAERVAALLAAEPSLHGESGAQAWAMLPADLRDPAVGTELLTAPGSRLRWVRAAVLFRLRRLAEAESVAATDPGPAGQLIRAGCLAGLGRSDEARRLYEEAARRLDAAPYREPEAQALQREIVAVLADLLPPSP